MATSTGYNQRIQGPYGDIFSASAPVLDKLSQTVYNEHLANEQRHQKNMADLDNEFAKNLAGVRQADVPDVVQKWQEYKKAKIGTYKNNLNDLDRINQEQSSLQKLGDVWKTINNSKQTQAELVGNAKAVAAKRNMFRRDASTLLTAANSLPSDKVKNYSIIDKDGKPTSIDLTNPEHLLYPVGSSDLTKIYDYALTGLNGKKTDKLGYKLDDKGNEVNVSTDPLQTTKVSLSGLSNTAPVIARRLLEGIGKLGSNSDDFLSENPHLSDPNYQMEIDNRYNALVNSPAYQMAHKGKPADFPQDMYSNELGRAAITKAKELLINNGDISETPEKPVPNLSAKMDRQDLEKEKLQNQAYLNALSKQTHAAQLGLYNDKNKVPTPPDILNEYTIKQGEYIPYNPLTGKAGLIVNAKNIDAGHLKVIGTPANFGGGKSGFIVNDDGSWTGANGQKVSALEASDKYVKAFPNTKFKLQARENFQKANPTLGTLPAGTVLTGADGHKIKTTKPITKKQAEDAGYKMQ